LVLSSKVRRALVRIHRYAGLFTALFLFVAGLTGTVIAFYKELDHALNPDLFHVTERSGRPLEPDEVATRLKDAYPHAFVSQLMLDRRSGESVHVYLTARRDPLTGRAYALRHSEVFLDPWTGRVIGGRLPGSFHADRAHLMPFIYRLHYTLALPGRWGTWFMGLVAIIWTLDCLVAFTITLPPMHRTPDLAHRRVWLRRWRTAWLFKRHPSGTRLNFDLHRAGGLWLWAVLFMLALSSVYLNLKFELFRPVLGALTPLTSDFQKALPQMPQATGPVTLSLAEAIVRARSVLVPELQYMTPSYVGYTAEAPGFLKVRFADPGRGDRSWMFRYETLFLDGQTGALAMRVGYASGTAADKFVMWQYPLHSGQVLGFWGRAFIGLIGIIVAMLSLTGLLIWLRKRRSRILVASSRRSQTRPRLLYRR
jgi:uncharacterized iron-regulated membrane protein